MPSQDELARFLLCIEETGSTTIAADRAGFTTMAFYMERKHNPEFKALWEDALSKYRSRQKRYSGITDNPLSNIDLQMAYLDAFKEHGLEATAAELVGILVEHVNTYRRQNAEFDLQCQHAEALVVDRAEAIAWDQAFNGVDKPVYQSGICVGYIKEFDAAQQHRLLKSRRERFRDSVKVDQNVRVSGGVLLLPAPATSEQAWLDAIDVHPVPALPEGDNDGD